MRGLEPGERILEPPEAVGLGVPALREEAVREARLDPCAVEGHAVDAGGEAAERVVRDGGRRREVEPLLHRGGGARGGWQVGRAGGRGGEKEEKGGGVLRHGRSLVLGPPDAG
jgi:hypothetical protein